MGGLPGSQRNTDVYRALPCGKSQQKRKKKEKEERKKGAAASGVVGGQRSKAKLPERKLALSARTKGTPFQMSPATWRAARVSQS